MVHSLLLRSCVLLSVLASGASAQFTTAFDRTYQSPEGIPYTSIERCVARADGGFYVVLQRYTLQGFNYVVDQSYLARLDAQGLVTWSTSISTTQDPVELAIDAADNAFVAIGPPARVESYASDSSLRWSTTIPGGGQPLEDGFGVTPAGTTVLAHWDTTFLKAAALDANGVLLHDVTSSGSPTNQLTASMRPDGTIVGTTRTEAFLIRADGTLAWTIPHDFFVTYRTVSGPSGEIASVGMDIAGDGIVRVRSATGARLWEHVMTSPSPGAIAWWAAKFDSWGGLVVAGERNAVYWATADGIVASFDASGALRWSRTYDGPANVYDHFYEVHADRSGNLIAAGWSATGQNSRLIVSSWNRDGDVSWQRYDPEPYDKFPNVLLESRSGDVVVGGVRTRLNLNSPPDNPYYDPSGFLIALRPDFRTVCLGDGVDAGCPCGNVSSPGAREGCANSSGRGARLTASGVPRLTADTLHLALEGSTPSAPGVYFQGSVAVPAFGFGDGLRCAGGSLRRMYSRTAQAGASSAPSPGDPSVSARSAATGDVIGAGSSRVYQVMYRDVAPAFCPSPMGAFHNLSSGVVVTWSL